MAINLTGGVIAMLCNGDAQGADVKPVLQVADIRLVNTQQQNNNERYRILLSDGIHLQQGMLATQRNELVKSGKLQKGSVVQLTQFVCNVIQGRMIIIIIDLDVILEKCDPIGEPKQFVQGGTAGAPQVARPILGAQSSVDQLRMTTASSRSYPQGSGSVETGSLAGQGVSPKTERCSVPQFCGGSVNDNPDPGRFGVPNISPMYPKPEPAAGPSGSATLPGKYADNSHSLHNPKSEDSRAPVSTYSRPSAMAYQQPPPIYTNRGPVVKNEAPPRIIPIAALNPYQGRWTIKARVTAKGELRHYNNTRGDGKVFSFDLLDSDGGEIRVTCFNAVADQFYNQIEAGKVYLISKGTLKPAQKSFNHLNNEHEIFLESTSTVQICFEDDKSIPQQQFHFRPISDVEGMENNSIIDFIGVVSSISPSASIMRKNGTETHKRTLMLKDMSGRSVELTLWGNFCNAEGQELQNMCDSGIFPVVAVKAGRVNDFNGKSVGTISSSQLFIEPDFPEARRIKEWFENEGKNIPSISISRETSGMGRTDIRKTVSQIKDEKLGTSEKPDWITVKATISFIKVDNFCYTACPLMIGDRKCSKKVTNNGDGKWRCDRCDSSVDECDYRYILQLQIQDHTGLTWVTAFQECGEEVMGLSAKDLYYLKYEEQDDEKFAEIIRAVLFNQYLFKLKVKEETFSDEQRVKSTVVKAEKVNFSAESRFLLDLMDKLQDDPGTSFSPKAANIVADSGMNNYGYATTGSRHAVPPAVNQVGQYGNQYSGARAPMGTVSGGYMSCNRCGGMGHNSMNCPAIIDVQGQSRGGGYVSGVPSGTGAIQSSSECYKCHQVGHWARDCPGLSSITPAYGSSIAPGRYGGVPKQHVGGF